MEQAKNQQSNEESLIVVKQLPIIEQQLLAIKEKFTYEAETALSMACTEDTLQTIKKKRSELTKVFTALETKRKEAKKSILAPYEAFEQVYKECVTEIYSPCDRKLAEKIQEVENGLKEKKRVEVEVYFNEYCKSKNIDFVSFDKVGLNITLSISPKKLKEQTKEFLDKVADELGLIETQENRDEILVEYKASLNVAQAITIVTNRHKAIAEEKAKSEEAKAKAEAVEKSVKAVEEAAEPVSAPIASPDTETTETEKKYSVSFVVIGTMEKIKALKDFLVKGEYEYEQQ